MPLAEFKDFNILINNKPFFVQPVRKQAVYEKFVEMSKNYKKQIRFFVPLKLL